jgi:hypothetical protein
MVMSGHAALTSKAKCLGPRSASALAEPPPGIPCTAEYRSTTMHALTVAGSLSICYIAICAHTDICSLRSEP